MSQLVPVAPVVKRRKTEAAAPAVKRRKTPARTALFFEDPRAHEHTWPGKPYVPCYLVSCTEKIFQELAAELKGRGIVKRLEETSAYERGRSVEMTPIQFAREFCPEYVKKHGKRRKFV